MEREVAIEDLKKLYTSSDMVKADCGGCKGCHDCCCGMGDSIVLDPYDIYLMNQNLKVKFEELLNHKISLHVEEGLILPNLKMQGKENGCAFLNKEGRCTIHAYRPGFCRLFPLGRIYENGSFSYYLQSHECTKEKRTKVKVNKWLGIPNLKQYENFVCEWHYFLKDTKALLLRLSDEKLNQELSMYILKCFYTTPFDLKNDFYEQFEERMRHMKKLLQTLAGE